jgi:hypothetical protein
MGTQTRWRCSSPPSPRATAATAPSATGAQWAPPAPSSASSSAASTSPSTSSRSPRHARATSPSESGDQRDTHGSYGAHVRPSAPRPRTTSALQRRERCTMPRRRTPMCRAPMCGPRTWLTDQSHEMGDGRPRCLPPSRQRWPAPHRRVRPERHIEDGPTAPPQTGYEAVTSHWNSASPRSSSTSSSSRR